MDKANIGAGENLEAAPKGHTMRSGDDRRRNLTPSPGDILRAIGDAVRAVGQGVLAAGDALGLVAAGIAAETGEIQPGAEGAALT